MDQLTLQRLTRFETYDEIIKRLAFVTSLDASKAVPEAVVGTYHFLNIDKRKCGISSCGTPHQRGFLIAMEDGRETLIGNRCGKNRFGLAFGELVKEANRLDRLARDRQEIEAAIARGPVVLAQIESYMSMPKGARWLASQQAKFRKVVPPEGQHEVSRMARRGEAILYTQRLMTENEVEIAKATGQLRPGDQGPFIKDVVVATLEGLDIWNCDLRALLVDDLQLGIKRLRELDLARMSGTALRQQVAWLRDLPRKLQQVERLISAGAAFFTPENVQHLIHINAKGAGVPGMYEAIRELRRP